MSLKESVALIGPPLVKESVAHRLRRPPEGRGATEWATNQQKKSVARRPALCAGQAINHKFFINAVSLTPQAARLGGRLLLIRDTSSAAFSGRM